MCRCKMSNRDSLISSLLISAFLIYSQYIFFWGAASVTKLDVFFRGIPFEVYLTYFDFEKVGDVEILWKSN